MNSLSFYYASISSILEIQKQLKEMKWMLLVNLASFLLGLLALVLPVLFFFKGKESEGQLTIFLSMVSCLLAICTQLGYLLLLINAKEWKQVIEHSSVAVTFSLFLVVFTVLLNLRYVIRKSRFHLKINENH